VGSSIVRDAFLVARQRPDGVDLSLQRLGVRIFWQGRGGVKLLNLKRHIKLLMTLEDIPPYIVIHIGGNDIGETRLGFLVYRLKRFMSWLSSVMPHTQLIWSQVLPRENWRFSENKVAMEKTRKRLNSSFGKYMRKNGGGYVRYPDIQSSSKFIKQDGVHLTSLGNEIYLNNLQHGLEEIIYSNE